MITPQFLSSQLHHHVLLFSQNHHYWVLYHDKLHTLYSEHEVSLEVGKNKHCTGGLTTFNSINQYKAAKGSLSPCRCLLNDLGIDISYWPTLAFCALLLAW
ncbi:hypothetical protein CEXT_12011 [Caerostris extrusa]|uniref:Uncharacterized protein n=1 Tax=Caerostris extrusa TaxID=172846 RepID=A0AAV4Y6H4_CAEEX|nr:hypothetical protein CEXT_12011 [Caerostris extrusa]